MALRQMTTPDLEPGHLESDLEPGTLLSQSRHHITRTRRYVASSAMGSFSSITTVSAFPEDAKTFILSWETSRSRGASCEYILFY
ncbi:hypothetical protein AVEN_105373-1 [Araneus ventricosus]|uniref:Uncharacterized protein n=1 Tax=Araneus ventricosus TaxID=182803 RepID=A0A4Y2KVB5_ARAVE|nr:hypothetical protein AVEN_105373-1 [Araneus ventricosus]